MGIKLRADIPDVIRTASSDLPSFDLIVKKTFKITNHTPLSPMSKLGDDEWKLWDPSNERYLVVDKDAYSIKWSKFYLPKNIMEDIKIATYLLLVITGSITGTLAKAKCTCRFILNVIDKSFAFGRAINCLSDISISDISLGFVGYPYSRTALKSGAPFFLRSISTQPIIGYLSAPYIQWNQEDINSLPWSKYNSEHDSNQKEALPSGLFRYRSDYCRWIVNDFLVNLKMPFNDGQEDNQYISELKTRVKLCENFDNFNFIFNAYIETQNEWLNYRAKHPSTAAAKIRSKQFKRITGLDRGVISFVIRQARHAAINLIFKYTGMREADGCLIQTGCMLLKNGMWYLHSTVNKHRKKSDPMGGDTWVAIDVIRDAVQVLEIQNQINKSKFLLSSLDSIEGPPSTQWYTLNSKQFLPTMLRDTPWEGWEENLTNLNDRHSLVKELSDAGVGLPSITRQLQHLRFMLSDTRISKTCVQYGGIGAPENSIILKSPQSELGSLVDKHKGKSRADRLNYVYGEGAVLAGTDAERIKNRIETVFAGLGLFGKDRESYIADLSLQGFDLPACGFGLCGRNAFGDDSNTPCLGDLECDVACHNNIIDESQTSELVNHYNHAVMQIHNGAQRRNQAYWLEREKIIGGFLMQLGENPSALKAALIEKLNKDNSDG